MSTSYTDRHQLPRIEEVDPGWQNRARSARPRQRRRERGGFEMCVDGASLTPHELMSACRAAALADRVLALIPAVDPDDHEAQKSIDTAVVGI